MQINFNNYWVKALDVNLTGEKNDDKSSEYLTKARGNLKKIGDLANQTFQGYKLVFKTDGTIDNEYGGYWRMSKSILQLGIDKVSTYKITEEKDINYIDSFINYLKCNFEKTLIQEDEKNLEEDLALIDNAIKGLETLKETYSYGKEHNHGMLNVAINKLNNLLRSVKDSKQEMEVKKQAAIRNAEEAAKQKENISILQTHLNTQPDQIDNFNKFIEFFNNDEIILLIDLAKEGKLTHKVIDGFLKEPKTNETQPLILLNKFRSPPLPPDLSPVKKLEPLPPLQQQIANFTFLDSDLSKTIDDLNFSPFEQPAYVSVVNGQLVFRPEILNRISKIATKIGDNSLETIEKNRKKLVKSNLLKIVKACTALAKDLKSSEISRSKIQDYNMITFPSGHSFVIVPNSFFAEGNFNSVKVAYDATNKNLVVRTLLKKNQKNIQQYINDGAAIVERCGDSPYLARIFGIDPVKHEKFMEIYSHGDLNNLLKDQNKLLTNIKNTFISCAEGVKTLHDKNFTHNDIKPHNFLITKDNNNVVLADFDFVNDWEKAFGIWKMQGTPGYSPLEKFILNSAFCKYVGPNSEQLIPLRQGKEVKKFPIQEIAKGMDVYGLGATFYEILTGTGLPWVQKAMEQKDLMLPKLGEYLKNLTLDPSLLDQEFPEPTNKDSLLHLVWTMVHPLIEKRPTMKDIVDKLKAMPEEEMQKEIQEIREQQKQKDIQKQLEIQQKLEEEKKAEEERQKKLKQEQEEEEAFWNNL